MDKNTPENKGFHSNYDNEYNRYKEELKNYYKKKQSNSDYSEEEIEENPQIDTEDLSVYIEQKRKKMIALLNYAKVIIGFFLIVFLSYVVVDSWILPATIHSKDKISIPKLSGMNIEKAKDKLSSMNLIVEIAGEQYNAKVPPQTVIRQSPNPNTEVKVGRTVYLTISKGKETVEVPYLIGKSVREAKVILLNKGFKLSKVLFENSESIPRDSIIKQSQKPGKFIPYGSDFVLTVSKGSENQIQVPRLEGMAFEDIEEFLMVNGFVLGNIKYESSDTYLPGAIIGQYPLAGETVPYNSAIDITVAE